MMSREEVTILVKTLIDMTEKLLIINNRTEFLEKLNHVIALGETIKGLATE